MFKNVFFASLITVGFVSSAQTQTLSKSFDVNANGANATLVGLGNVNINKSGQFQIGPSDIWSLKTGKLNKAKWNLSVQYLGAGREMLTRGPSEFGVNESVVNVEFENSILKYERSGSQIEQIIVVKQSPIGSGNLRVGFSMSDRFSYELQKDGGFNVSNSEKILLEFGALTTTDATGRVLPSRIQLNKNIASYIVEDEGAVYPITIDPIVSTPSVIVEGQNNGQLGFAVDTLDINGDGFADLIVGEDRYANNERIEGRIYLFLGSVNGLAATAAWELESDEANARFGASVRNLGDINGDGNEDFAIGAALSSKGSSFGGNVSVFLGDDAAPGTSIWEANGTSFIEVFGSDIVTGDFNCDGINDIAISSNFFNDGANDTKNGRVQIYNGTDVAPYFSTISSFSKTFPNKSEGGTSMVAANINGDQGAATNKACMDLIVGRPRSGSAGTQSGGFDVFLGTESGPSTTPSSSHEGTAANERTGFRLGSADLNKDGFDDLVVTAYLTDNATDMNNIIVGAGRISIHNGSAAGLVAVPSTNIFGTKADTGLGYSLVLGDFDNNGFIDIGAGAPEKPGSVGEAFVYLNASGAPSTSPAWTTSNGGIDGRFGDTISAGDFNNDGFLDLVVGAVYFDTDQGSFYIYEGKPTCTIGDDVYSSGDVSMAGCGICDPVKSTTDWSDLPVGTTCGAETCSGEGLQVSACDGNAQCVAVPTLKDCGAFTCDAALNACFDACRDDAQCEAGATCDSLNNCISSKPTAVVSGLQSAACSDVIVLSAKDSTDPADAALTYAWSQVSGIDVIMGADTTMEELTFTAPIVDVDTILEFSLTVKSEKFDSDPINYQVTIAGCPTTGDNADMGETDTGVVVPDMQSTDSGPDSSNNEGTLSGGGCGCMSSQNTNPAGSIFLVFILGFLALRRKKRS